jgi:hypothetical protein
MHPTTPGQLKQHVSDTGHLDEYCHLPNPTDMIKPKVEGIEVVCALRHFLEKRYD